MKLLNRSLRVHSCLSDGERETEKESEGKTERERERERERDGEGGGGRDGDNDAIKTRNQAPLVTLRHGEQCRDAS